MAATQALPVQAGGPTHGTAIPAENAPEDALVPSPLALNYEAMELSPPLARLPVELEVAIPVRDFRVRNLLALEPRAVLETHWCPEEDMPLAAGQVQLAWIEFEVVDTQLAVRVTRLA